VPDKQPTILVIPEELAGHRLDQALARLCPQHSRARLQGWIRAGRITVNGAPARQKNPVRDGDVVRIVAGGDAPATEAPDENIPLDILHEDAALIVIDKPAGLVVHPGAGNPAHTLMNALLHHAPALRRVPRAGIVQRLDKNTSGLMVIAATPEAHTFLTAALKAREIRREYTAIVAGRMTAGGRVEAPIARHPRERTRMAVVEGGRSAVTHYRVLKRFPAHTLLRVRLETGRTHQIRVHMAHIRHPIVGDPVYGGRPRLPTGASEELREALRALRRQALHASGLAFAHPDTGREMHWEIPLPRDMQQLLDALERG
jgi:23S rRNA pseudouridine1911/1915/1917 synthase